MTGARREADVVTRDIEAARAVEHLVQQRLVIDNVRVAREHRAR
jgi:hypothetical protein